MKLEKVIVFGLIFFGAACAVLSPADQNDIATDAAKIAVCQQVGRTCKADGGTDCYGEYNACVTDAGLRGGK